MIHNHKIYLNFNDVIHLSSHIPNTWLWYICMTKEGGNKCSSTYSTLCKKKNEKLILKNKISFCCCGHTVPISGWWSSAGHASSGRWRTQTTALPQWWLHPESASALNENPTAAGTRLPAQELRVTFCKTLLFNAHYRNNLLSFTSGLSAAGPLSRTESARSGFNSSPMDTGGWSLCIGGSPYTDHYTKQERNKYDII